MNLDDFAKSKTRKCGACTLPPEIRDQVDSTLRSGDAGPTIISNWLTSECGIRLSDSVIRHHLSNAHHVHTDEVLEAV